MCLREMRVYLSWVIVALFLSSCASVPKYTNVRNTPAEEVLKSYISLRCGIPLLYEISASGTIIDAEKGLAVTNKHVTDVCGTRFNGATPSGESFAVVVIAESTKMDIALLQISRGVGKTPRFGSVEEGGEVWAIGAPFFGNPVAHGKIKYMRSKTIYDGAIDMPTVTQCGHRGHIISGFMIEANIHDGYSGGPVVNSNGEVIGITTGIYTSLYDKDCNKLPLSKIRAFVHHIGDVLEEIKKLENKVDEG